MPTNKLSLFKNIFSKLCINKSEMYEQDLSLNNLE